MSRPGETARAAALALLKAVLRDRRPLDDAWQAALAPGQRLAGLAPRDRAFARLLAGTVLRRTGQLDAVIDACLDRPLDRRSGPARNILRLGAAQLLFLGTPAHAAVDGAVRQAGRAQWMTGLVNAVLRRLARDGAGMLAQQDAARLNCPRWLWESWCAAYGEETARRIVLAVLAEPPLDLTPVRPEESAALQRQLEAALLPTGTLRRNAGGAVEELPGFADGAWFVQDAAASLPARLLAAAPGEPVLDLCAAPGGKSLQLAAAGARVTAVDLARGRLNRLADNLTRTGLAAELVKADATQWRPPSPFPKVLLDAPCSSTGTLRRHPDVWRLKRPQDVDAMAEVQAGLLQAAAEMVAPGGTLVYCVCSLQPEEGPERIAALLGSGAPFRRQPVAPEEVAGLAETIDAAGDLRTLPCHLGDAGGMDGFYACRLVREAA